MQISRPDDYIRLGRPAKEAEEQCGAFYADSLTTQAVSFEKFPGEEDIDPSSL